MENNKFTKPNVSYTPKEVRIKNDDTSFTQQKLTYDDAPLFFPEGFEKIFLLIYFMILPYIFGLIFLFFYVGEGKTELFLSIDEDSSFILTWAIGYEILAAIILLLILKAAITFSIQNSKKVKNFRRP